MTNRILEFPAGQFEAYLFDLDGTIADSMPLHFRAWTAALEEWGCPLDTDLFYAWAGIPLPKTVQMLNEKYGLDMPVDQVVERKEKLYLDLLPEVKPIQEVLHHIQLQFGKIPLAVVSGSPRTSVMKTLTALCLLDRFSTIVGGDDCAQGKPDPASFLLAAKQLDVLPGNCLVFEDADLGIQAAQAAGMAWIKVSR